MKTNTLIRKDYMHVVVCLAMAVLSVGSALGGVFSSAKPNPEYIKWQKRRHSMPVQNTPASTHPKTRLLAASGEDEVFNPRFTEGVEPSYIDFSYLNAINNRDVMGVADPLPRRHDPRDDYTLTPVRQQDPQDTGIGTCWAQASVGSMETWLAVNGLGQHQFSVKNMVNLIGYDRGTDASKPRGWFGGNAIKAAAYLLRWAGPVWESDDPYTNRYGVLNYSLVSDEFQPQYHVQQMRIVPARTGALDNEALKRAILEFGGLYATMKLYTPYYTYKGKTYLVPYWNTNGAYYCPETGAEHAVTLVGWDDDYPKENFNSEYRPKGNGAFIVKDSYGTETPRDNGYIYVSYYDTTFAYSESYAFPQLENTDNYATIYQYDTLGLVDSYVSLSSAYAANIFTAKTDCLLDAVGFYAVVPNEPYTLSVYVGCKAGNPTDGEVKVEQSGVTDSYAGYYTVKLDEPVSVRKGQRFSIVMKLTSSKLYPIPVEMAYEDYSSEATASAGQSFVRINPTDSWLDMTEVIHGTANFCCKAYTKSATAVKTLSSVSISGVSSVKSGTTATFTCKAKYSDGSEKSITPIWSVTSGGGYASISSSGVVTANKVTDQQTVKIQASYTDADITKTDSWSFYVTVAPPAAPTGLTATQGDESSCVRLLWPAVDGATSYAVYRGTTASSGNARFLGDVTAAKYADIDAVPGVKYYYFVKAKNSSGPSAHSAGALGWRALSAPADVAASDGASLDYVEVTWTAVAGAKYYRVYRSAEEGGTLSALGSWQTDTGYRDETTEPGIVYYYYVVSAVDSRGNMASGYSIFDDGFRKMPTRLSSIAIDGAVSIASGESATYSCTATMTDGTTKQVTPTFGLASGSSYATLSGSRLTAKTVTANQTVTLSASYTEDGITKSATKSVTVTAVKPSAPTGLHVKSQTASGGIVLGWTAVPGAESYKIYRAAGDAAAAVCGTSASVTFADSSAVPGFSYVYWVSAVNSAGESALSAASVSGIIPLAAPAGVTASSARTDGVAVTWSALPGATHYRVSRATSATGAKTDLGVWQTGTTYLDTSAVAGTKYWYFVRAATSSAGANASAYSTGAQGVRKVTVTLSSIAIGGGAETVAAGGSLVFSCTATYSDGTTRAVTPTWSVSPTSAATIDANGAFKAGNVTVDTVVAVAARYTDGTTKTATKSVTVIAPAPAKPTVSVSGISAKPRWPFAGLVDVDYTVSASPEGTKAAVSVSGFDHDHNVPLAARTLSGEGASAPVEAGRRRITWNVAADYPGFHAAAFSVTVEVAVASIVAPSGLTASQGTSTDHVSLTWDAVTGANSYEIWRGTSTDSANAEQIGTSTTASYSDESATPETTYYYWVKAVSSFGASVFSSCVSGYKMRDKVQLWEGGPYWATTNIGAEKPEDYGYYFWWGDTVGYKRENDKWAASDGSNSKFSFNSSNTPTSNKNVATLQSEGWITPDGVLAPEHDAAQAHWGGDWRMPTKQELEGLNNNCDWTWTTMNGVNGYVVRGRGEYASNSIFLPCAGYGTGTSLYDAGSFGSFWSSVPRSDTYYAWSLGFDSGRHRTYYDYRRNGQSVRPLQGRSAPTNVSATDGTSTADVTVTWSAVVGATSYEIWRGTSSSSSSATKIGTQAASGYTDIPPSTGTAYYYWVKAVSPSGTSDFSASDVGSRLLTSAETVDGVEFQFKVINGKACIENHTSSSTSSAIPSNTKGSLSIPSTLGGWSVTSIGDHAFYVCSSLTSVTIPSSVTSIGDLAFWGCSSLTSVTIPSSVTSIGAFAFEKCSSLTSVTIPSSVTSIVDNAFSFCGSLMEINVSVDNNNYMSKNGLLLTKDEKTLIAGVNGVVTIPSSVTSIRNYAFRGCSSLTSVTIPSSVTSIGHFAFWGCSSLTSVTIPSSVTSIGLSPFPYCGSLMEINVSVDNNNYMSKNGLLLTKDEKMLIAGVNGVVTIPSSVTSIGDYAFRGYSSLTSVTIPSSVTSIGIDAFSYCRSLTSVTIPSSVASIGRCAFDGCSSLTSVTIPSSVTSIGDYAFDGCSKLSTVYLGESSPFTESVLREVGVSSSAVIVRLPLSAPTNVSATDGTSTVNVTVTWSAVAGATSYEIWRGTSNSSSSATKIGTSTSTSYSDTSATSGTTYYYWVKAVASAGTSEFSSIDSGYVKKGISLPVALDIVGSNVSTGGDEAWLGQDSVSYDMIDAAQSGDIADGQTSWMEIVVKDAPKVSFWWKVSSEANYDKLHFYVDGNEVVTPISGQTDWIKVEYALTSGSHTLKWAYTKDGSVSNGDDCGWVDSVVGLHEKVQLWEGGPYWATTNIGAEKPEDYGYYFWWGDTVGYKRENDAWVASDGSSSNFSFTSDNVPTFNKDIATLQSEGWITADGVLASAHDAAKKHWGGDWRMPTMQELDDLISKCDWTWTTMNGVNGYVVRGRGEYASNSIFLPCAGYGYGTSLYYAGSYGGCWSSVPNSDTYYAWALDFNSGYHGTDYSSRYYGQSVRPLQGFSK